MIHGDYLALLCRLVGLGVVRGDSEEGGSSIIVSVGPARRFEPFVDLESIEQARKWLNEALNQAGLDAVATLH